VDFMNALQRLELILTGRTFVGYRNIPRKTAFYAFKCPIHGIVEDYQHGYKERLDCPLCPSIKSVHPDLTEKVVQEALPIER